MFLQGKRCVALEKQFPGHLAPAYSTTKGEQFSKGPCVGGLRWAPPGSLSLALRFPLSFRKWGNRLKIGKGPRT